MYLTGSSYRLTILLDDVRYTAELENYQSFEFMDYRRNIELGILQAYDGDEQFQEVQVLRFSSGFEMKVVSRILLKFKNKTKHLKALVKKMSTQKFGRLKVFPAVGDCGCYEQVFGPTPLHLTSYGNPYNPDPDHKQVSSWLCSPGCNVTCSPTCTPNCCTTITSTSVASVGYSFEASAKNLPYSPLAQCTAPCGAICAPSCTPACCYTIYRAQRQQDMYRKRHQVQNNKDRRKYEATLYRNNPKNQKKHKELKKNQAN
ncbi:uncharacterized protein LOC113678254 [Pocillopora damicornis]|uniref:uncharacterized protein LOC113678254 n=1 Tax=Pocillopora damicornis TaxID=46731 RepID=UPI000F54D4DD|nr:uncharacterized protein LOC113678254 [Pocillopora damicornis]